MKTTSTRIAVTQKPTLLVPPSAAQVRHVQLLFNADNEHGADLLFMIDGKDKLDGDREYDFCPAGGLSPVTFPLGPGQHVIGASDDAHLVVTVLVTTEE